MALITKKEKPIKYSMKEDQKSRDKAIKMLNFTKFLQGVGYPVRTYVLDGKLISKFMDTEQTEDLGIVDFQLMKMEQIEELKEFLSSRNIICLKIVEGSFPDGCKVTKAIVKISSINL